MEFCFSFLSLHLSEPYAELECLKKNYILCIICHNEETRSALTTSFRKWLVRTYGHIFGVEWGLERILSYYYLLRVFSQYRQKSRVTSVESGGQSLIFIALATREFTAVCILEHWYIGVFDCNSIQGCIFLLFPKFYITHPSIPRAQRVIWSRPNDL